MKKLLTAVALLTATFAAMAATPGGTVQFSNLGSFIGTAAPVYLDAIGGTKLGANDFFAQLYAGPSADSLSPVGVPVLFKSSASTGLGTGLFDGGIIGIDSVLQGAPATLKVAAWDGKGGANSYDKALAAGNAAGFSGIITVVTGQPTDVSPPGFPGNMVGLQPWFVSASVIPEPTTIALGLLGAAGLLLRRRI